MIFFWYGNKINSINEIIKLIRLENPNYSLNDVILNYFPETNLIDYISFIEEVKIIWNN